MFIVDCLYCLIFVYFEILFKLATGIWTEPVSALIIFLFSLSFGCIAALITRPTQHAHVNRIVTSVMLIIIPVIYLMEYFIYRSFNVFYDLNTIINGAGGALTEFGADIRRLIISKDGISMVVLCFVPFFVYIAVTAKKGAQGRRTIPSGIVLFILAFVFFVAGRCTVKASETYEPMYVSEYNYQNAVSYMGLATGLRLDVISLSGGEDDGFVIVNDAGTADMQEEDLMSGESAVTDPVSDRSDDNTAADPETLKSETAQGNDTSDDQSATGNSPEESISEKEKLSEDGIVSEDGTQAVDDNASKDNSADDFSSADDTAKSDVPVTYAPNILDIDFAALADTTDGKLREMDLYVDSLAPSMQNEYTGLFAGKNLIFITAEAFSGYLIDPELTPTLYRLANRGIQIKDYYQPAIAGTTGGEYANLFGLIPTSGGKSMSIITSHDTSVTIGNKLNDLGYYGRAYHDNNRTIYNRDETHERLGYSDGFMGIGNGMEEYLRTSGFPASDLEMFEGSLPTYIDKQPFDVYYMTVSGHGQYGRGINQMSSKNYDRVATLDHSEIVKCYLAANIPLEDGLTYMVNELEKAGIADDTVIVLGADHFPYNLDTGATPPNMPNLSELYGFDVTNYLERDSNTLIIWSGCLEDMDPIVVDDPVFSPDILPTLCNLFGVPFDSRLFPGRDIFSDKEALVFDGNYDWKTSLGTYISSKNRFTPVSEDVVIPEDYIQNIRTEVKNRMNYCKNVLNYGYFDHVFAGTE